MPLLITRRLQRLKMRPHSVFTIGDLLVKDYGGTDRKDYPPFSPVSQFSVSLFQIPFFRFPFYRIPRRPPENPTCITQTNLILHQRCYFRQECFRSFFAITFELTSQHLIQKDPRAIFGPITITG